jgi:hypothetical protein
MMVRIAAILVAFALVGCHGESSTPQASGKGAIRAINAIPTSTDIAVQIEERSIGGVAYKASFPPEFWDDLSYTFNFDTILGTTGGPTRIASVPLDVVADIEYTMVIRGDLRSPTITIWEKPERDFGDSPTVFEIRVGHASASMGNVDVFFAPEGVDPAVGQELATLSPGQVTTPADYAQDPYVLTITTAGNPADVLFRTAPFTVIAGQSVLITLFDGTANDPAPYFSRLFNQSGQTINLSDDRFLPTTRYIHGTTDLETSDIYDDVDLTNRVFTGLAFGEATGDIDTPLGENTITFTPVDNVGSILFETTLTPTPGGRLNIYMTQGSEGLIGQRVVVDRRSIETFARLSVFHSASNHEVVDIYVVETGESIDGVRPTRPALGVGLPSGNIALDSGDYDIYVTTFAEKTVLDGPVPFTAELGSVYEGLIIDRTDPALAEFKFLPPP